MTAWLQGEPGDAPVRRGFALQPRHHVCAVASSEGWCMGGDIGGPQVEALKIVALAVVDECPEVVDARLRAFGARYGADGTRWLAVYLCQVIEYNLRDVDPDEALTALMFGGEVVGSGDEEYALVRPGVDTADDLWARLRADDLDGFAQRWRRARDEGLADLTIAVLVSTAATAWGSRAIFPVSCDRPLHLGRFPLPAPVAQRSGTYGFAN